MDNIQFPVGSEVRYKGDKYDSKVLGYSVDENGVVYKITGRSVNMETMEVTEGVRHVQADDLEAVAEEENNSVESENE
jgi:hypothetical protein